MLYFLSSTCPCSQAHFDYLNDLVERFPNHRFVGLQSHRKTTFESARNFYRQFEIKFPILFDRDLKIADGFKALKTPHIFMLNRSGEILFQGGATNSRSPIRARKHYLRDALTSLKNGKEIKIKNAKTIGCYIQR